jgi:twitching motility two-component system response regulator PilG
MNVKLAKLFVEKGYISLDNLKVAVEDQKNNNKSLGEILITRGFITESQLVDLTNIDNQFPSVDLTKIDIPEAVIKSIPKDTSVENNLIPFGLDGTLLSIAMIDPTNLVLIDELRFLTGYNINPYIAEFSNIKNALKKYYDIQYEEVVQKVQPEQKPQDKVEAVQKIESEQKPQDRAGFSTEQAPQQEQDRSEFSNQLDSQVSNQVDSQASADPKEEIKQAFQQEQKPEISDNQEQEKPQSTPNEITDVFAKATDVSDRKEPPQSGIDDLSSQSSNNLFQSPGQETGDQNIFQSPSQQPVVGFQVAGDSEVVQNSEPDFSAIKDSSEQQLNVFASNSSKESAEDLAQDKTIELSLEAEELPEEVIESKEITDVFSIPVQDSKSAVEGSAVSAKTDDKPSQPSVSPQSSEQSKQTEDLFKIPEQDNSAISADQNLNDESDLRSLKEDSSYDNIESFNKSIDAQIDAQTGDQVSASSIDNEAVKADLKGLEPVESDLKEAEKPSENESVIPIREEYVEEAPSAAKPPTVLVVDDSPTVQKIVSVTLSRHGYNVEVTSNAMQALAKLNDFIPDIIFLDINLPHMDGYQLCKIIKGNDLTKEVPVVMLSGKDGFFDKMRGKMVGATDYITKPFEPSTLVSAIKKQGITISGVM